MRRLAPTSPRRAGTATPSTTRSSARASAASPPRFATPADAWSPPSACPGRPRASTSTVSPISAASSATAPAKCRRTRSMRRHMPPQHSTTSASASSAPAASPTCTRSNTASTPMPRSSPSPTSTGRRRSVGRGPGVSPRRASMPTIARCSTTPMSMPSKSCCRITSMPRRRWPRMDAGKHVSLQKPMTTLVADADRLIEQAKATGGRFPRLREFHLLSADRRRRRR